MFGDDCFPPARQATSVFCGYNMFHPLPKKESIGINNAKIRQIDVEVAKRIKKAKKPQQTTL